MSVIRPFEWDVMIELERLLERLLNRLKELDENKECGIDGVRAIVLKRAALGFVYPLMFISNELI